MQIHRWIIYIHLTLQYFVSLSHVDHPRGAGTFQLVNKSIRGDRGAFRRLGS